MEISRYTSGGIMLTAGMSIRYYIELARHGLVLFNMFMEKYASSFRERNTLYMYMKISGRSNDLKVLRLSLLIYAMVRFRKNLI